MEERNSIQIVRDDWKLFDGLTDGDSRTVENTVTPLSSGKPQLQFDIYRMGAFDSLLICGCQVVQNRLKTLTIKNPVSVSSLCTELFSTDSSRPEKPITPYSSPPPADTNQTSQSIISPAKIGTSMTKDLSTWTYALSSTTDSEDILNAEAIRGLQRLVSDQALQPLTKRTMEKRFPSREAPRMLKHGINLITTTE
jgi:hypothetical protein